MISERTQSLLVGALMTVAVVAAAALLLKPESTVPQQPSSQRTNLDTSAKAPTGMVHYIAGPDDDFVLRYQGGSCREAGGPTLQLTDDDGWSFHPIQVPQVDDGSGISATSPVITSVVSLTLGGRHRFTLDGTDDKCRIRTYTTTDAGQTWQQKPFRADSWYVDPKTGMVKSPNGPASIDCPGVASLTGFDDDSAVAYCTDGSVYQSSDGKTWDRSGSTDEVATSVFFESADDGYASWPDRSCQSSVFRTTNGGVSWSKQGCISAQVLAFGIGGIDTTLMAGGTGNVLVSADRGKSWERPDNPDNDSAITDRINGRSKDDKPDARATPSDSESDSPSDKETPSDDASDN